MGDISQKFSLPGPNFLGNNACRGRIIYDVITTKMLGHDTCMASITPHSEARPVIYLQSTVMNGSRPKLTVFDEYHRHVVRYIANFSIILPVVCVH